MLKKWNNGVRKSNNNVVVLHGNFDEGDDGEVLTVCRYSSTNAWVLDSRASYHMTSNHNWFNSFKEWNHTVKMSDDWVKNIKGSGTVHIKMHNGIVRKLDYWFISEFRKNLIYLGTLAKDGLNYSGEGNWL